MTCWPMEMRSRGSWWWLGASAALALAACQGANPRYQDEGRTGAVDTGPIGDGAIADSPIADVATAELAADQPAAGERAASDAFPDAALAVPDVATDGPPDVMAEAASPDLAPPAVVCSPPVGGSCNAACVLCSMACRPKPFGCTVLVRSQGPDPCMAVPAGIGCGTVGVARSDLTNCQIGIIRRQLELNKDSCTLALWQRLGREGCQEIISLGRHRQPPLDPTKPIVVAYTREIFTATGNYEYQYHIDDTTCGALGVPGSAP
jgi:hypothetical protein